MEVGDMPSTTEQLIPWLVVAALLALAVLIGYSNFQNARAFRIQSSSTLPPEQVLDRLQSSFAKDGWILGYRDAGSLVMSIDRNASLGGTAAIGCLSVWFALLHVLTANRRITVQVDVTESMGGSIIITNGSRSGSYLKYVAWHLDDLPKS